MTQPALPSSGLGARRTAELEARVSDLRSRSLQCRELADWALSAEGRETLTEMAVTFQSEAHRLEHMLASDRETADA